MMHRDFDMEKRNMMMKINHLLMMVRLISMDKVDWKDEG